MSTIFRTTNACASSHFNNYFYNAQINISAFVDSLLKYETDIYTKIKSENLYKKGSYEIIRKPSNHNSKQLSQIFQANNAGQTAG